MGENWKVHLRGGNPIWLQEAFGTLYYLLSFSVNPKPFFESINKEYKNQLKIIFKYIKQRKACLIDYTASSHEHAWIKGNLSLANTLRWVLKTTVSCMFIPWVCPHSIVEPIWPVGTSKRLRSSDQIRALPKEWILLIATSGTHESMASTDNLLSKVVLQSHIPMLELGWRGWGKRPRPLMHGSVIKIVQCFLCARLCVWSKCLP